MILLLHYGNFGGVTIKILWCLGALAPGVLAVTGTLMWWKRKVSRKRVKARSAV